MGGDWNANLDADGNGYVTVNYGTRFRSAPLITAACGQPYVHVNIGSPTTSNATLTCHKDNGGTGSANGSWAAIGYV